MWVFFATVLLLGILIANGALEAGDIGATALLAPTYLLGTALGSRVQYRISDLQARRAVLTLIVLIATGCLLNAMTQLRTQSMEHGRV